MLKLVRLALTGAVLTAIAIRLRRRSRLPEGGSPVPRPAGPARPSARRLGMLGRWGAVLAGILVLAVAAQLLTTLAFAGPGGSPAAPAVNTSPPPAMNPAPQPTAGTPASTGASVPVGTPVAVASPSAVPGSSCRAEAGPVVVRSLDPALTRAVDRQWKRVEEWLKAKAPVTYETLGRPGRAHTIAVAEAQMGVRFPDSLRASLLRHDSTRFGFLGGRLLSTRGIRDTWRELCSGIPGNSAPDGTRSGDAVPGDVASAHAVPADAEPADGVPGDAAPADAVPGDEARPERWDGSMIPLAHDGAGGLLVADPRTGGVTLPGPGGLRFTSYYALLKATADSLESGVAIGRRRPVVVGGRLRWQSG